ncbi:MAG TPA: pilus assembly protein PilM [Vicinamibacterales bacterium]|nr:pilus assembly protein PilM [Vicinamibacterales bacterium]
MTPGSRSSSWFAPAPPTVAIEIAARRVTVVGLGRSGGGSVVAAHASEALPDDAVVPGLTTDNIPTPAVVVDALRRALERAGLRSTRRAALIVPDSVARVSLLPFEQLPGRQADLDQLIRWQLKKATPFPIDDAQVSYFVAHAEGAVTTMAAVVARRAVVMQYEAVAAAAGVQAGVVDLASLNVMNTIMAAGATGPGDWLVVCLAAEATTLSILRGQQLMFYRHRTAVDEEPLSALVHQTAMFHEDRLGGTKFGRVWLCGAGVSARADQLRHEIGDRLGVPVETVDVRPAADLTDRAGVGPEILDALAAPVGMLLRERKAA